MSIAEMGVRTPTSFKNVKLVDEHLSLSIEVIKRALGARTSCGQGAVSLNGNERCHVVRSRKGIDINAKSDGDRSTSSRFCFVKRRIESRLLCSFVDLTAKLLMRLKLFEQFLDFFYRFVGVRRFLI